MLYEVITTGFRVAQTNPRIHEVLGGDGFAVAPENVITECGNHVRGAISIVRNRDVFRLTERERAVGIRAIETFIQVRDVDHAVDRFVHVRVERGGFRSNANGRITSYNVCYTKLLRPRLVEGEPGAATRHVRR